MTVQLEITTEQHEEFKVSEFVHICSYRRGDEVTCAWVDRFGTQEECQEARDLLGCSFYIVPVGLTIHSEIVATADISLPEEP